MYKECREACGGQGQKTENRVGPLQSEYDVQSTFEGDNNVLMQQVHSLHQTKNSALRILREKIHCIGVLLTAESRNINHQDFILVVFLYLRDLGG